MCCAKINFWGNRNLIIMPVHRTKVAHCFAPFRSISGITFTMDEIALGRGSKPDKAFQDKTCKTEEKVGKKKHDSWTLTPGMHLSARPHEIRLLKHFLCRKAVVISCFLNEEPQRFGHHRTRKLVIVAKGKFDALLVCNNWSRDDITAAL